MTDMQLSRRPVPPEVLEALKAVVGPSGFLDQASDTGPYCKSWRDDWQGRTALVLRPQSTEEVSRIVAICASAGVALVPQGGNTGLTGAGQPGDDMSEIVLSTSRMKAIREIDIVNGAASNPYCDRR